VSARVFHKCQTSNNIRVSHCARPAFGSNTVEPSVVRVSSAITSYACQTDISDPNQPLAELKQWLQTTQAPVVLDYLKCRAEVV